jgi:hypothetical protein
MLREDKFKFTTGLVVKYFEANKKDSIVNANGLFSDEIDHIIKVGTDMLLYKWDIELFAGGFAKAFVDNDLRSALGRADTTCEKAFKFFGMLLYNTAMPREFID